VIPATTNFTTALAAFQVGKLQIVITIASYPRVFSNFAGSGLTPWIVSLDDMPITVDDLNGGASVIQLFFTVQDKGAAITGDFPGFVFEGKLVTVQVGLPGLALADFTTVFTGFIDQVDSANNNLEYYFTCSDISSKLAQVIYTAGDNPAAPSSSDNPRTVSGHPLAILLDILNNQVSGIGAYIDTGKITAYMNGPFSGMQCLFHIQAGVAAGDFIKNQLLKPLGGYLWVNALGLITVNFFYPLSGTNTQFNVNAVVSGKSSPWPYNDPTYPWSNPYDNGSPATQIRMTEGQQVILTYASGLISTGGNPNLQANGDASSGSTTQFPGHWTVSAYHSELLACFVDVNQHVISGTPVTVGNGPVTMTAPPGTVYLALGVNYNGNYQTDNSGSWTINLIITNPGAAGFTLGPGTWTSIPTAEQTDMVNTVQMQFDKDDADSSGTANYLSSDTEQYAPSVSKYGLYGEQVIAADGVRSALQGFFISAFTARLIFGRYGFKNLKFDQYAADAILKTILLEPGDLVSVTHPQIPNRAAGVMGISNAPFEILNKNIKFTEGLITYTMLDASYLSLYGDYLITPNGESAYAAASSGDKTTYMFLCADTDLYSNGDPGHVLG
jgi:hypothetical protein